MARYGKIYDLHIHTFPDVKARKCNDLELAIRLQNAGFAGFLIKNHFSETASRARLLRLQFPDLKIAGGVALNRSVGGLNPFAVENCGKLGGRFVWLPTMEARSYLQKKKPEMTKEQLAPYLSLVDENNQLLPEVYDILDVIASYGLVLATGHVSAREGLLVLQAAKERGITRMVVTHADSPADFYSEEQQMEAVKLGAVIEHSYYSVFKKQATIKNVISCIKRTGVDNTYISTDFGQVDSPYPDEGMEQFIELLLQNGLTEKEIECLTQRNPERVLTE
jgi:hypothetical protein